MAVYREYLLESDVFNKPKTIDDQEAISTLLVRLILLEPGTFASHPRMGVGLVSKFRYMLGDDIVDLRNEIRDQINTYLPEFNNVNVVLSYNDNTEKSMDIEIRVDESIYKYTTILDDNGDVSIKTLST